MPFDWKNGWIPIVLASIGSFIAGLIWASAPIETWCGSSDSNTGTCLREWLLVLAAMLGGVLTLVAAIIAARAVLHQTKATENIHLGPQRAARTLIDQDLHEISKDFNVLWELLELWVAADEREARSEWYSKATVMTDHLNRAVERTAAFSSIGQDLNAIDRRKLDRIVDWTKLVKDELKAASDARISEHTDSIRPHMIILYLSHWLRAVTLFTPELRDTFRDRTVKPEGTYDSAHLTIPYNRTDS